MKRQDPHYLFLGGDEPKSFKEANRKYNLSVGIKTSPMIALEKGRGSKFKCSKGKTRPLKNLYFPADLVRQGGTGPAVLGDPNLDKLKQLSQDPRTVARMKSHFCEMENPGRGSDCDKAEFFDAMITKCSISDVGCLAHFMWCCSSQAQLDTLFDWESFQTTCNYVWQIVSPEIKIFSQTGCACPQCLVQAFLCCAELTESFEARAPPNLPPSRFRTALESIKNVIQGAISSRYPAGVRSPFVALEALRGTVVTGEVEFAKICLPHPSRRGIVETTDRTSLYQSWTGEMMSKLFCLCLSCRPLDESKDERAVTAQGK